MADISNKVLIDPSLLLAQNSLYRTLELLERFTHSETQLEFYYPQSLLKLIYKLKPDEKRRYSNYFVGNAQPSEPDEVRMFLERSSKFMTGFEIKVEQREKYHLFYENLRPEAGRLWSLLDKDKEISDEAREILGNHGETYGEDIINILFEEWVFLNEYSWLVSRIKKTFTRFTAAGSVSLQFGWRATYFLIRKSLKKKDDELLSKVDKLRAIGKWIAVAGPSIAGIIADPLLSLISLPTGFFLLFDPDSDGIDKILL